MRKVLLEVEERRRGEIKQAILSIERCANRSDSMARELQSLAHEVTNAGNGRNYRGITVFRNELFASREINVRVFDLVARDDGRYELRVSYFQVPGG